MTNKNLIDIVYLILRQNNKSEPETKDMFAKMLHKESIGYFKELVPLYQQNQSVTDRLTPFETKVAVSTLTTTTTTIDLPTNYAHFIGMYYTDDDNKVRSFDIVTDDEWDMRLKSSITFPTETYPICKVVQDEIYVSPSFDQIAYADWFLPSRDELKAMYDNLHVYGVGGFVSATVALSRYWSSHNILSSGIFYNFNDGSTSTYFKNSAENVRACRIFTAAVGAYSLRDVGPAGGLIFYVNGTTYYEAAPSDQTKTIWSNVSAAVSGTSTAIGTGQNNTTLIINQVGHTTSAAKICNDLIVYA